MKYTKLFILALAAVGLAACGGTATNTNQPVVNNTNANTSAAQVLKVVERPQSVKDKMAARGEQDAAQPKLAIQEPKAGATINSSTVKVTLQLSGDLKGYMPHMDHETKTGNHVHIILDNQPYEAYYEISQGAFELRNVADGEHTLRVFPSRPWHEAYKNADAFQMVKFTVKNGGADASKPTTTSTGQTVANANSNSNTATPAATPEGKDMQNSTAGAVDTTKPLLTFSRPKGEYKGADADPIMIDFWLSGAKLKGDGGEYRVRYTVDGGTPMFIDKWEPIWLSGCTGGKHTVKLELIDADGGVVDNGGYNTTSRDITVVK